MKIRNLTPHEKELLLAADSAHDKKLTLRYILDGGIVQSSSHTGDTHTFPSKWNPRCGKEYKQALDFLASEDLLSGPMRRDGTAVYLLTAGGRKLLEEFRA
jgi:hypothetical protein